MVDLAIAAIGINKASKLLGVSPNTIAKWFDEGLIQGYRLPATRGNQNGDRRLLVKSLYDFMRLHKIPTDSLTGVFPRLKDGE